MKRRRFGIRSFDWGFAGLIVMIVLLEALIFRNVMFYGLAPGFLGQLGELEASFEANGGDNIELAIIGDSQSMDALRPEQLAESTGKPAESIFNFSLSGGSAFDMAHTYDTYRDRMPNLKRALVLVNEHQVNESRTVEDIKFRFHAGLADRIKVMDQDNYGELLLGWALRSYAVRTELQARVDRYLDGELRKEVPVHAGGLPPLTWSPSTDRTEEYAIETADRWFEDFEMGGVRTAALERLIKTLLDDGVEVTIVKLPRHEYFETAIRERHSEEKAMYDEFLVKLSERYHIDLEVIPNDQLELETHFRDTNHVNEAGAAWVNQYVVEHIL